MFEVSESTRCFSAVERERVEAAALLAPERLVEAVAELGRLAARAGRRARGRARPPAPARPCGASRRRRSPAPRRARSAPIAWRPSCEELRVVRVLPRLVLEPALRPPVVLDEAVAVEIAVLVDPARAPAGPAREASRHERGVVGPAPDLGEEDEEERRRVDRAVVAREPGRRGLARADLVDDLARLGVGRTDRPRSPGGRRARPARSAPARARRGASAGT